MRGSDWEPLPTALVVIGLWLMVVGLLGGALWGK